jgi:amino-acid N-acetyltransferase
VINGGVDDGLLAEVFSNEGIGTLVYVDDYQQIRRARRSDVRAIEQLIKSSIEKDELAPRSRASIEKELGAYFIFEVDGNPIACVALHSTRRRSRASSRLYVRPSHENQGIGRRWSSSSRSARRRPAGGPAGTVDAGLQLPPRAAIDGVPDDLPARRESTSTAPPIGS